MIYLPLFRNSGLVLTSFKNGGVAGSLIFTNHPFYLNGMDFQMHGKGATKQAVAAEVNRQVASIIYVTDPCTEEGLLLMVTAVHNTIKQINGARLPADKPKLPLDKQERRGSSWVPQRGCNHQPFAAAKDTAKCKKHGVLKKFQLFQNPMPPMLMLSSWLSTVSLGAVSSAAG